MMNDFTRGDRELNKLRKYNTQHASIVAFIYEDRDSTSMDKLRHSNPVEVLLQLPQKSIDDFLELDEPNPKFKPEYPLNMVWVSFPMTVFLNWLRLCFNGEVKLHHITGGKNASMKYNVIPSKDGLTASYSFQASGTKEIVNSCNYIPRNVFESKDGNHAFWTENRQELLKIVKKYWAQL